MDGRQSDYSQTGLSSSYPSFPEPQSEGSPSDQASAAQYPQGQDPRSANFSSSATPTSEYGINPSSARSGSFPEYIQRPYPPQSGQASHPGGMAQATSPSMPLHDGQNNSHNPHSIKSDSDVPIDPSIAAATSPSYPPHAQYSPYGAQHDMSYQGHPGTPMYPQRPEWGGQYPPPTPHGMPYGHGPASSGPPAPAMVSPVQRPPTVSSHTTQRDARRHDRHVLIIDFSSGREDTRSPPSTRLFRFPARSSTSAPEGGTRRLSECTSAAGTAAKRRTARSTT